VVGGPAVRTEVLIADHILRVGQWKLVAGVGQGQGAKQWRTGNLKGCMLGTGGGWMLPGGYGNASNACPGDIYTSGGSHELLGCPDDVAANKTKFAVSDPVDLWLCSDPCTPATPCLWDVVADPGERQNGTLVAQRNPAVAAALLARLAELQKAFQGPATIADNGKFCEASNARAVAGIGRFLGPWID
jgi:hypothetical protein